MNQDQRIQLSENELVALSDEQLETTVGGASLSIAGLSPVLIRGIPWDPYWFNPAQIAGGIKQY